MPDIGWITERLAAHRPGRLRGDFDLQPSLASLATGPPRDAAVLIPIAAHATAPTLVFTQRSSALRHHAGQISFPGGRIEAHDASPTAAALRESHEEIGLIPEQARVIGHLDPYFTGTGFRITPVVATIPGDLRWTLDPREVDEVFEVPLKFLLDPANWQRHSRVFQGAERHFYAIVYGERYIWGATAGMIIMLADALAVPDQLDPVA